MTTRLPIGDAAAATGLSPDALRYYEREGLIGPISRDTSGRRLFTEADVAWIGVVTCMRGAGLGMADLRTFTTLLRSDDEPSGRTAFLRRRREDLLGRRETLDRAIQVLEEKIEHYGEDG